jgi:large subunit ribosomal protein L23
MELNIYDVIKKPVMSSKSLENFKKFGKITFYVHTKANKITIREAVEKIWNVKVDGVNVISLPGKTKYLGRKAYQSPAQKKAIITLKKGYKIEIPGMFETMGVSEAETMKQAENEGK